MTATCKTCRWWNEPAKDSDGHWAAICRQSSQFSDPWARKAGDQMMGQALAFVYTGPDFGCIHHEPKETS